MFHAIRHKLPNQSQSEAAAGEKFAQLQLPSTTREKPASLTAAEVEQLVDAHIEVSVLAGFRGRPRPEEQKRLQAIESKFETLDSSHLEAISTSLIRERMIPQTRKLLIKTAHQILDSDKGAAETIRGLITSGNPVTAKGLNAVVDNLDHSRVSHSTCQTLYALGRSLLTAGIFSEAETPLSKTFSDTLREGSQFGIKAYPGSLVASTLRGLRMGQAANSAEISHEELSSVYREVAKGLEKKNADVAIPLVLSVMKDCLPKEEVGKLLLQQREKNKGEITSAVDLLKAFGQSHPEFLSGALYHIWGSVSVQETLQTKDLAYSLHAFEIRSGAKPLQQLIDDEQVSAEAKNAVLSHLAIGIARDEFSPLPKLVDETQRMLKKMVVTREHQVFSESLQSLAVAALTKSGERQKEGERNCVLLLCREIESNDPSQASQARASLEGLYGSSILRTDFTRSTTLDLSHESFEILRTGLKSNEAPQVKIHYILTLSSLHRQMTLEDRRTFEIDLRSISTNVQDTDSLRTEAAKALYTMGDRRGLTQFLSTCSNSSLKESAMSQILADAAGQSIFEYQRESLDPIFSEIQQSSNFKKSFERTFNYSQSSLIVGERLYWLSNLPPSDFDAAIKGIDESKIKVDAYRTAEQHALSAPDLSGSAPISKDRLENLLKVANRVLARDPSEPERTETLADFHAEKLQTIAPLARALASHPDPASFEPFKDFIRKAEETIETVKKLPGGPLLLVGERAVTDIAALKTKPTK